MDLYRLLVRSEANFHGQFVRRILKGLSTRTRRQKQQGKSEELAENRKAAGARHRQILLGGHWLAG